MRRTIDVRLGPCPLEPPLRHALASVGALSLLFAPTGWGWKAVALAALFAAWRWTAESSRRQPERSLRVHPDGTAGLVERGGGERPVRLTGRAWLSRVACAIELREGDSAKPRWFRVCAAGNTDDEYRRLLGVLRLQAFDTGNECID